MNGKEMIGARLKQIRTAKGYTQEQLSELVGINSKYLSSIERGKENPTLNTILKLTETLNVSLDDIFTGLEIEDPKIVRPMIDELLERADQKQLKTVHQYLCALIRQ